MGLVDDLTDIQAIERDDFRIAFEPVDLADVLRRAAGLFAVRAADAGVTVDIAAGEGRLMAIGEFRRVLQILVNLIGNALRYSPRGGTVRLRVERDAGQVVAVVADEGKGIAPEDQPRIFAKFVRVDPREPGGSGLGLYISRRLARAMGGDISVDSTPGEGARFVLSLPVA
jgi:signal transduction histidine kinase